MFDHQDRGLYPRAGNPQCINDGQCVHVMYVISQKSLFLQSYCHHPGHPQGMPLLYTLVPVAYIVGVVLAATLGRAVYAHPVWGMVLKETRLGIEGLIAMGSKKPSRYSRA